MTRLTKCLLLQSLFVPRLCLKDGFGSEALKGAGSLLFYVHPNLLVYIDLIVSRRSEDS